ncbi:TetR/AcrR family transcriptional regulator [Aliiglaciecola sp. CAU 1673]|uniref:TetR/AcrR family transcriptional regulator n=1 Tax=Aliiglaciecola sp. CAU 1673 TaxID=3032595 RepID=UPI0023DBBF07|nr:TetR/AcrR family transcriptional regulator [Aliiglaciecola sp. CAU 1673]MDF2176695.1 TetR/AcrR family transcriptional regulator [Aliiglaciecola sp. CAU 1673]
MRNAEFDRQQVLRSAMHAFMHKGYNKTSMQDLTAATGLHPGSIYCAFGNKKGLLLAAVEQYRADRTSQMATVFSSKKPVLAKLKDYLDGVVQECLSCNTSQSCLLTKAITELAEQDPEVQHILSDHLKAWQNSLQHQFQAAIADGELPKDSDPVFLSEYLVMGIYGLRTFAHTQPQPEVLIRLAERLYANVCT